MTAQEAVVHELEVLEESRDRDRFEQRLRVPPGLACLAGHFPELPVLPGLAQLDWAVKAAARLRGRPVRVARLEAVKFRRLLGPGDEFTACLRTGEAPDRVAFEVTRGDQVAASGRLRLGALEDLGSSGAATPAERFVALPVEIEELVPHAPPMLFLHRLLLGSAERTVCSVRVDAIRLFREPEGGLPAWAGMEAMAQCVAAHGGLDARRRGEAPRIGFLLGCRRLSVAAECLEPGVDYAVAAAQVWGADQGLVSFDCELFEAEGSRRLLAGRLNAYLPESLDEVLEGSLEP